MSFLGESRGQRGQRARELSLGDNALKETLLPRPHFQTQNSEAQRGELQQRCPCSQLAHLRTAATGTGTRENQEKEDVEVASWALGTTQKTLP